MSIKLPRTDIKRLAYEDVIWGLRFFLDQNDIKNVGKIAVSGYNLTTDDYKVTLYFRNGHIVELQLVDNLHQNALVVADPDAVVTHCWLVHDLPEIKREHP